MIIYFLASRNCLYLLGIFGLISWFFITNRYLKNIRTKIAKKNLLNGNFEMLRVGDYGRVIDRTFNFVILNKVCKGNISLLVAIHSAPENYRKRSIIRKTWGLYNNEVKIVFMLGLCKDKDISTGLARENNRYKDMVQGNFVDTYRNLTYKHVMVLKYSVYHCWKPSYILKVDDDAFINIKAMLNFLKLISKTKVTNVIFCKMSPFLIVPREVESKWQLTKEEYPSAYFPPYCLGFVILYTSESVFTLYKITQKSRYFWIDDVHITGTMVRNSNIRIVDLTNFIGKNSSHDPCKFLLGHKNLNEVQMRQFHMRVKLQTTPCIDTSKRFVNDITKSNEKYVWQNYWRDHQLWLP